jgi:hypothetical protein
MKVNVNDYVRTKDGISKVVALYSNAIFNDKNKRIENNLIIKSSEGTPKGLLSLIEVGDYVNGYKVESVDTEYESGVYIEIPFVDSESIGCNVDLIRPKEIESIVTREMFESMEYKVGEV